MADKTLITLTSPDGATLNTAGTYCEGDIEIIPNLQEKTATESGIVTADEGYSGLKSVDTTGVYEAGKKSEYDKLWGQVKASADVNEFSGLFSGGAWTNETFRPPFDIIIDGVSAWCTFKYNRCVVDLTALAEELGIRIVFRFTRHADVFNYAKFIRLPTVDMSTVIDNGVNLFSQTSNLETIDKLILAEQVTFDYWFTNCTALTNLTIEGTIGQNGFNVSWSPLSKASIISVINALSDTTTGLTVTLRMSAIKTAFETSEGAADGNTSEEWLTLVATKSNWTINAIDS